MAGDYRDRLHIWLAAHCTGMDDHDGDGDERPLLQRCEKCRMAYDFLSNLIQVEIDKEQMRWKGEPWNPDKDPDRVDT